jgi:hypothetical protein
MLGAMVNRSIRVALALSICLTSCSKAGRATEAPDIEDVPPPNALIEDVRPLNTLLLPIYDVVWTPPDPAPSEVIDTPLVLFTSKSPDEGPVQVKVRRSAAGTEPWTDVTMRWDGSRLAALSIRETCPTLDCQLQLDGVWDTFAVRGGLDACILTNDAGITFIRWWEQDYFIQFEARMTTEESLSFVQSLEYVSQG